MTNVLILLLLITSHSYAEDRGKDIVSATPCESDQVGRMLNDLLGIRPVFEGKTIRWNQTLFFSILRKLRAEGVPLTQVAFRDRFKKDTARIIEDITGRKTTGASFVDAATKHFKSWDEMLALEKVYTGRIIDSSIWTKKTYIDIAKILRARGVNDFDKNNSIFRAQVSEVIEEVTGMSVSSDIFISSVRKHFGSWDEFLNAGSKSP